MNKQRMSNILSSVQMNPRDRKDFIDELSKLGQGEQGGEKEIEFVTDIFDSNSIEKMLNIEKEKLIYFINSNIVNFPHDNNTWMHPYSGCINFMAVEEQDIFGITILNIGIGHRHAAQNVLENIMFLGQISTKTIIAHHNLNTSIITDETDTLKMPPYLVLNAKGNGTKFLADNGNYRSILELYLVQNASSNKTAISGLSLTKDYTCQLTLVNKTLLGNYYNGTFIAFSEGKIVRYDIDSEGNVTQDLSINPELIGTVAKLEVGDADDVCQRNLEIINMAIAQAGANHFDVDIDYGVGSATFTQGLADDAIAGTATIIVATGYVTKYNLYANGKVEKVGNDIDLFALEARIAALEAVQNPEEPTE